MSQVSILPKKTLFPRPMKKNTTKRRGLCIDFVSVGGGPFYSEISRETNIGRFGRIFWSNNTEAHEAQILSPSGLP